MGRSNVQDVPLFEVDSPVLAAPMAGGPSTPELVTAAARAGALGFLAAGYLTADALRAQLAAVDGTFGVNLFAPNPTPVDPAAYAAYRESLLPVATSFGVDLPAQPREDDDAWTDKVELLLARPVPVVSFTFGLPPGDAVRALRRAGSVLLQTVTSPAEAQRAVEAGMDGLVVQSPAAGGHSATFTPDKPPAPRPLPDLVAAVRQAVDRPLYAAGGIAGRDDVAAALAAGAAGVLVGTVLLKAHESGTSAAHRAGLDARRGAPTLIRGFSGRPAGGLRNSFVDRFEASAPLGYPAVHHLTRPLRRAAAQAGDPEFVNLWAGRGYDAAIEAPAATVLNGLAPA